MAAVVLASALPAALRARTPELSALLRSISKALAFFSSLTKLKKVL
jgi:hypothetical protein